MLKHAYELGVRKALEEVGLTKEAFLGQALTKGLSQLVSKGGTLGRGATWAVQHPLAAKTLGGAAIGGVGGGLFGGEGGFGRGALMGAGIGAGAHAGGLLGLGRGGRMARQISRTGMTVGRAAREPVTAMQARMAASELARRGGRAGMGALAGGAGAGALGYGLTRPEPPPWYR
jgi:hypothetical protein